MDEKDIKIIDVLKENARNSTRRIATKTGLPITTVHNRLKKLENGGIILGYTVNLDYEKIGTPLLAYLFLKVDYSKLRQLSQEEIKGKIIGMTNPEECHIITGDFDTMLKMHFRDPKHINKTIEVLRKKEWITHTHTMVVLL